MVFAVLVRVPLRLTPTRGRTASSKIHCFLPVVFLESRKRVAALAMVMGLCLFVYSIGQRALRNSLAQAQATVANQLGKPTAKPTLRWIFQCFMSIHLVRFAQLKQISNLTSEQSRILQFFGSPYRKYYLLCRSTSEVTHFNYLR